MAHRTRIVLVVLVLYFCNQTNVLAPAKAVIIQILPQILALSVIILVAHVQDKIVINA